MNALWQLTTARIREFIREPGAVFWTFGFPVLLTVALGLAFRQTGAPSVVVAVVDGPRAQETAAAITSDRVFPKVMSKEAADDAIRHARVVLGVDANADSVIFLMDPTRPDAEPTRLQVDDALQRRAGRVDPRKTEVHAQTRVGGRYVDWLVPGLLGTQLLTGGMWGVGWVIVDQRSRKLMKRMLATPMRRSHFLLSVMLARLFGVVWEVAVIVLFGWLAFGVTTQGSFVAVCAVSLFGAAAFSGMGLLVGSRAQNTQTAGGLMNLAIMPMMILSGVFFSSAKFPDFLQPVIAALPLTALNDVLRMLMNDGASIIETLPKLAIVAAWGGISFVIALRIFRWN